MAKRYNFLTRCLAAIALLFVYVVGSSAILVGATAPAQAWRGRGYGFRGGYGRGYRRYGYGLAAAGVAAGVGAAGYYRGGCGPYAYYDSYYGACRYY